MTTWYGNRSGHTPAAAANSSAATDTHRADFLHARRLRSSRARPLSIHACQATSLSGSDGGNSRTFDDFSDSADADITCAPFSLSQGWPQFRAMYQATRRTDEAAISGKCYSDRLPGFRSVIEGIDSSGPGLNAASEIAKSVTDKMTRARPIPPASRKMGTAGLNSRAVARKPAAQRYF